MQFIATASGRSIVTEKSSHNSVLCCGEFKHFNTAFVQHFYRQIAVVAPRCRLKVVAFRPADRLQFDFLPELLTKAVTIAVVFLRDLVQQFDILLPIAVSF